MQKLGEHFFLCTYSYVLTPTCVLLGTSNFTALEQHHEQTSCSPTLFFS